MMFIKFLAIMEKITFVRLILAIIVVALLVLVVWVYRSYQRDLRIYRQRIVQQGSQIIDTACGPIEYARTGSGYPVLVIHGNGGGFDQGLLLSRGYIPEGYEVIALSRFGYLRTPLPANATVAAQADAYACLLDALHIQRAAILTTSAGVTSSIQFALNYPERVSALILHSPNSPGEVGLTPPPQPVFSAFLHSDFAYWVMTTYLGRQMQSLVGVPKGFVLTPELQGDVDAALKGVLPSSERTDGMVFDTYVGNPAINSLPIDRVAIPTLVISTVDDPMTLHERAKNLAGMIPGARLLVIADGGHMMLGHTNEVRAAITQFLSQTIQVREK